MSTPGDEIAERDLLTLVDEHLIALYLGTETASAEKEQIRDELCRRYYPYIAPEPRDAPWHGRMFRERVEAVIFIESARWRDEYVEKCCSDVFEKLFIDVGGFANLLSKFNPQRASFRHFVINVLLRNQVIDWLRKRQPILPSDRPLPREQEASSAEGPPTGPPEDGPWVWWDAFLRPVHALVIRLLLLAYLDLNQYYSEQAADESGRTEANVRAQIRHLQQRLRPEKRFGASESMEIYTLNQILKAKELRRFPENTQLGESVLTTIVSSAAAQTRSRFSDEPPIEGQILIEMLSGALDGQPSVADFRRVLRRWIDFLESQLLEGKLFALGEKKRWKENGVKRYTEKLYRLGLCDQEIEDLKRVAEGFTLQELMLLQKGAVQEKERVKLRFQEAWCRLIKTKHQRNQILADYRSGKCLVKTSQREIADILEKPMGTIGGHVSKAQRALNGAVIWRAILGELSTLDELTHQRERSNWQMTCVIAFEGKVLKIGIPKETEALWRDLLLPRVEVIMQMHPVRGMIQKYKQTGMTVILTNFEGKWPPLTLD